MSVWDCSWVTVVADYTHLTVVLAVTSVSWVTG